ncbi:MAG: hydrogenobyrinic acid a,c-diamide synthase (glutamine-hydrolyzing) [Negativicutes bacterium]|nr:hydrogenobyrinic acid a,c-diamide synthase (glutamine-hydrolyzing) [Negativicutes bacterium]
MRQEWNIPRIVIGAPHGHSGKTTISIGLIGALKTCGYTVQPFKKGPDYIDPSWLSFAAGRPCRNLDCYWLDDEAIRATLAKGSAGADLVLIEGAMGLFDGVDLDGTGSTAQIARITGSPVVLVVDATRMTRSIAPLILGCMNFEKDVVIAGVILNKVARSRHEDMLRAAVERYCGIPVLGAIPKNAYSVFPERHLGLVPAAEHGTVMEAIADNITVAKRYLDLEGIAAVAQKASPLTVDDRVGECQAGPKVRIGIIRDKSFTFYYPENSEALAAAGAELVSIDSLRDAVLPPVDGLYIGGGFPEVFGEAIAANTGLRAAVKAAAQSGLPIYAECGGLMYLARTIYWRGQEFAMCGVLPLDVIVEDRPQGHGYTLMRALAGNPFFPEDSWVKGHEFHHSRVINSGEGLRYTYQVVRGQGIDGKHDGLVYHSVFATYNHIHATANPDWAPRFVALADSFRRQNG